MNCYICDAKLLFTPTWRTLFSNEIKEVVCGNCKSGFEKIERQACGICGLPGEALCKDCRYWETTEYKGMIDFGASLYSYNEAMQDFFHQYKFLQDVALAEVFAADIQGALRKVKAVIVPIPMNAGKLKERTFPQVDCLLDAAELPYKHLLIKKEDVQGKKTKSERMAAPALFEWNGQTVPEKVILVDDLYATGTTIRHGAKVLKQAGVKEVGSFTLIRG